MDGTVFVWRGTAHHVPLDIAAGAECRQLRIVDRPDGRLQVGLENAVQLEALPRRNPHRPIGMCFAEIKFRQELCRGHLAAGNPRADHATVGFVFARAIRIFLTADVSVILLIAAVKLDELQGVAGKVIDVGRQFLGESAAQLLAIFFDCLKFIEFYRFSRCCVCGHGLVSVSNDGQRNDVLS